MSQFRFVDGPLAGFEIESERFNSIADNHGCSIPTESGQRNFWFLPPLRECQRALNVKNTERPNCLPHIYERGFGCNKFVEFRYVTPEEFDHVLIQQSAPLSPEARERKVEFSKQANEMVTRVRNATLTTNSIINLITHYSDECGLPVGINRDVVSTLLTVLSFPTGEEKPQKAPQSWIDSAIDNIIDAVHSAPTGMIPIPAPHNAPTQTPILLRIERFEIEILEN